MKTLFALLAVAALLFAIASSVFVVDETEHAVITQF